MRLTEEKAVELAWEFEDRPWDRAGDIMEIAARKGTKEFSAPFLRSRTKTDRPKALRVVLRRIGEEESA